MVDPEVAANSFWPPRDTKTARNCCTPPSFPAHRRRLERSQRIAFFRRHPRYRYGRCQSANFLQYAGRYVRRPPIAQRRITWITERTVRFWYKDKKLRRRVYVQCSVEEFIDRWARHIPECSQHAVRSFGLFAPRTLSQTSAAIFAILGQERKPRPKPRRWADSVKRDFGRDPLLDHTGKRMKWARRIKAKVTP